MAEQAGARLYLLQLLEEEREMNRRLSDFMSNLREDIYSNQNSLMIHKLSKFANMLYLKIIGLAFSRLMCPFFDFAKLSYLNKGEQKIFIQRNRTNRAIAIHYETDRTVATSPMEKIKCVKRILSLMCVRLDCHYRQWSQKKMMKSLMVWKTNIAYNKLSDRIFAMQDQVAAFTEFVFQNK